MKVAVTPVAVSSTTDEAMILPKFGPGPVTRKVAAVTVAGFILAPEGTLKVTLMLAFGQAVVEPAIGLVDSTETFVASPGGGGTTIIAEVVNVQM